jgi:hypothetical protein
LVILLAALATALAVKGGGRFADKVLTAGRSSCPEGR